MRRRTLAAGLTAASVLSLTTPVAAAAGPADRAAASPAQAAAAAAPPAALEKSGYARQQLKWSKCFDDVPPEFPPEAKRMECATFTAPLNWRAPRSGRDIRIAVSRLRPQQGQPKGAVLLNPGGPGGPGLLMPLVLAERKTVASAYDLVGFDVRGTGESTNVTCGDAGLSSNDPRDRSRANVDLIQDTTEVFVRHCALRGGKLRVYTNTEQTVYDIDLLRHLLGYPKINWVGYSGGSWLGAYYATFFPGRVDRFVLDSNTEFTAPWEATFSLQPLGFERRFRQDFLPWAATYDKRFGLGKDAESVRRFYERLRADLNREPIIHPLIGTLNGPALDGLIAQAMYAKGDFQSLAQLLGLLRQIADAPAGGAPAASRLGEVSPRARALLERALRQDRRGPRPVAAMDAMIATFFSVTCNDTPWTRGRAVTKRESARQGRKYPLIGWSTLINPCGVWPRPNVHLPRPTGRGVPPVLMVQSVRDPATPLEGALRAHRRFAGSRLLTVTNEGDHGIYVGGNPCADAIVDRFLLTGVLPAGDTTCAGTGIPAPADPSDPGTRQLQPGRDNPLELNQRYNEILRAAQR